MNLFDLYAKITLDDSEYTQGVKKASSKADDLAGDFQDVKKNADRMESSLDDVAAELDDVADAADDAAKEVKDYSKESKDAAKGSGGLINGLADVKAGFDGIIGIVTGVVDAIMNATEAFFEIGEETRDFREEQAKLTTSFEESGYSAETAWQSYKDFYKLLGDEEAATTASQLLSQLVDEEKDASKWTKVATGVYATFGESLPIDGLIESANETANVGTVTGVLADALNWVGIMEDEFNTKLAECTTQSERNQLIMETLAGQYDDAAESFYETNQQIMDLRDHQAETQQSTANLGTVIDDVRLKITNDFQPAINDLTDALAAMIAEPGSEESQKKFSQAFNKLIDTIHAKVPEYIEAGKELAAALVKGIKDNLPALIRASIDLSPGTMIAQSIGGSWINAGATTAGIMTGSTGSVSDAAKRATSTGASSASAAATTSRVAANTGGTSGGSGDTTIVVQSVLDGKVIGETSYKYARLKDAAYTR